MLIHQSLLQSWDRCPQIVRFVAQGVPDRPNSATVYGSVMHHALHVLERVYRETGDMEEAKRKAIATWRYYWHPHNQEDIAGAAIPPDGWLPHHNWNRLLDRGVKTIQRYADDLTWQEHEVFALEYEFIVPIRGTDHHLAGTVDRISARWEKRKMFLGIDDLKTGKQKWGLRHNVQGTAYIYASLQPEFWLGFQGEAEGVPYDMTEQALGADLMERFATTPRRFTWISVQEGRFVDGGEREEKDFERFRRSVNSVVASMEAGIFPLNISGENCAYCEFRQPCGVPDEDVDAGLFIKRGGTRLANRRRDRK